MAGTMEGTSGARFNRLVRILPLLPLALGSQACEQSKTLTELENEINPLDSAYVTIVSGSDQETEVGTFLPEPLVVEAEPAEPARGGESARLQHPPRWSPGAGNEGVTA